MKKTLLACLLLAPWLAYAQPTHPYLIKGKIGRLNAPAKVYLRSGGRLDSATLKNGQFELKGITALPFSAELILERRGKLLDNFSGQTHLKSPDRTFVMLEPGPVMVSSTDSLRNAHITGGPLTADYQRLQAAVQPIVNKLKTVDSQASFDIVTRDYAQAEMMFIKANPNSWVSLEALLQLKMMVTPQYAEVAPLYEAFSPALRNSPPGRQYGEFLQGLKATTIGSQAPDFTQQTPTGKNVSLADFRGKYVLVDFWASWCGPCRQENPAIVKVYNTYKSRNFEILGVSLDDKKTRAKWVKAIADDQLPWVQVSDLLGWQNQAAKRYGVQSVPQNFLVDPTGKIVATNLHGDELQTKLAQLIK